MRLFPNPKHVSRRGDSVLCGPGSGIHTLLACSLQLALALFVLLSLAHLAVYVAARIPRIDEIGYGDSYVLFDTLRSARTGTIYPDLSDPPYLPAQYGPWLYLLHSWPAGISPSWNPFLGPRLLSVLSFFFCLFFVYRTACSLWKNRMVAIWSVTLAASCAVVADWVLQLRSDFFAVSCSFFAIWLLLKGKRGAIVLAGVLAASAIVFKLTMAAAVGAGFLWLLSRKRFRECLIFTASSAAFLLACYLWFARTEPRMIQQLLAASPPVIDYSHYWELIISRVLREPVLWLALTAIPFAYLGRRVSLLAIFAGISLLIALLTDFQAGGNVNYFFEFLFALAPLAGWAAVTLARAARRQPALSLFAAGVFLIGPVFPVAKAVVEQAREFEIGRAHV